MEGLSAHLSVKGDKIIIVDNDYKVIISGKNMLEYVKTSSLDHNSIISTLIKCIDKNKYIVDIANDINITCILEGTLQNDSLIFIIPKILLCKSDNYQIEEFTICKIDDKILIKNNKKYTKYIANIPQLYGYMASDIKYPIELFTKIIHISIENENMVDRKIKLDDTNYIISYSWDGIVSGYFDIVIPVVNFKFDNDKITSDIQNIPQANVIVNRMNTILYQHVEEKSELKLEDVDRELVRFSHQINIITQFDNIFHKIGRLYPHLSIEECKNLTEKYIGNGQLVVHSGKYTKAHVSGYGYQIGGNAWEYFNITIKIWNCCPVIQVKGYYDKTEGNSYIVPHIRVSRDTSAFLTIDGLSKTTSYLKNYQAIICYKFEYDSLIDLFRDKRISIYTNYNPPDKPLVDVMNIYNGKKMLSNDQITKYVSSYGYPRPDSYCLNSKILSFIENVEY